ncbi:DNA breaking-rejoining enzyme [Lentinula raphanica]|nr:DNA breaking-rejoining enzyme [Lentinula raphanica]
MPPYRHSLSFNNTNYNIPRDLAVNIEGDDDFAQRVQDVDAFLLFAARRGLSPEDVSPPSEQFVCEFAVSFAGKVAGATARTYVSAVKKWVIRRGLVWTGGPRLDQVLKGVNRHTPDTSVQEERSPVKVEYLRMLFQDRESDEGFRRCRNAVATVLFFGQMRANEALPRSSTVESLPNSLPRVRDLAEPNGEGARILHLPKTKTQQVHGEKVVITPNGTEVDPIRALRKHIAANRLGPDDPLFAFRNKDGGLELLSKSTFLSACNGIWSTHGIPRITGHCFRIGGTTHYLLAGVSPDVVKALGRWKSDAFLRYWRNLDQLATIHVGDQARHILRTR